MRAVFRNISSPHDATVTNIRNPFCLLQCLSVQCIYCQQIRAKNTSRQKQHLLECPGLRGHHNAPQPTQPTQAPNGIGPTNGYPGTPNGPATAAPGPTGPTIPTPSATLIANGVNPHATPTMQTPLQALQNRPPPMPTPGPPSAPPSSAPPSAQIQRPTPKPKPKTSTSNLPAPPLDDVHAAFVEFRAKEEDKVSPDRDPGPGFPTLTRDSACPCNVSTASKFARRTPVANASIC